MYDVFEKLVSQGKVERTRLLSIRVKLHVPCQWTCNFCHMEGNPTSQPIRNDIQFSEALISFRDRFGLSEVHFTGGEPSIHREIVEFITKAKNLGFKVKMTTNGQAGHQRYFDCIQAGLDELNMSIHTLDPAELGKLMAPPRNADWGKKALEKQRNVSWRLMNVLEIPDLSYAALKRACNVLGATAVRASIIEGSSSCSVDMQCEDGFAFKLKLIRPHFLEGMCSGCELRSYGGCYEFAYGPRLEMERGMLMVRNCVHRNGPPFSLPINAYFSHPIAEQLQEEL